MQLGNDLAAGQFQPPAGAQRELFHVLQGIEVGDEARVAAFMHMHQLRLAFDQVAAAQIGVAGQDLRAGHVVQHDGVAALAAHHRHHNISPQSLLERGRVGLFIGADTPPEMALSILAEVTAANQVTILQKREIVSAELSTRHDSVEAISALCNL